MSNIHGETVHGVTITNDPAFAEEYQASMHICKAVTQTQRSKVSQSLHHTFVYLLDILHSGNVPSLYRCQCRSVVQKVNMESHFMII